MDRHRVLVVLCGPMLLVSAALAQGGAWSTKAPMPTARSSLAVDQINGIVYAAGGFTGSKFAVATVEAYDPGTNSWTSKAAMLTAVAGAGATLNGKLYVAGSASTLSSTACTGAADLRSGNEQLVVGTADD